MKKTPVLLVTALLLLSCGTTTEFVRESYKASQNPRFKQCKVYITHKKRFDSHNARKMGSIEAKEPVIGVDCQENYVFAHFIADACSLRANNINITEETRPKWASTCYRAKADFLKIKETKKIKTGSRYHPDKIKNRSEEGHKRTKAVMAGIAGATGGALGAIVISD